MIVDCDYVLCSINFWLIFDASLYGVTSLKLGTRLPSCSIYRRFFNLLLVI